MIRDLKRHTVRIQASIMLVFLAFACISLADAFHWIEIGRTGNLVLGITMLLFLALSYLTMRWLRAPDDI